MSDGVIISKLNNQIKVLNLELEKNKKYTQNLEKSLLQLKSENKDIKIKYYLLLAHEVEYKKLEVNLKEKEDIITELEKEIIKRRKKYENNRRAQDSKYNDEILQLK